MWEAEGNQRVAPFSELIHCIGFFVARFNRFVFMHDTNLLEDQPIAWTPTPDVIERAQLTRFMKQVGVSTWDELYEFSIHDVEKFTEEVLKFLDIKFDPPYEKLLDTSIRTGCIEIARIWLRRGRAASTSPKCASTAGRRTR